MASISIDRVTKLYATGVPALSEISLEIADGEQVVIVGPSGCGKSTLLRLIAGLEEITGGTITVGGKDITNLAPKDRDVAMVFQDYALYPHMTVRKNMAYALRLRRTAKTDIDKRVEAAAAMLGLAPYLERKPGTLSGGQKQRVALGRAIIREPQAFLMDEPLSNLDAKLRAQMRAEINRLHDRLHTTTIYVTHDQAEAMTLADRIVVLRAGTVQQIASPENMYDRPANMFVAGFIGSPTMNFLRGHVILQNGEASIEAGGQRIVINDNRLAALSSRQGREVVVGVRPEHLVALATQSGNPLRAPFLAEIHAIENMGNERFLYLKNARSASSASVQVDADEGTADQDLLVAREVSSERYRRGDIVALDLDPATLHLFDADTEQVI
jgi:multiple sugar transport system ATP-binding protein